MIKNKKIDKSLGIVTRKIIMIIKEIKKEIIDLLFAHRQAFVRHLMA